MDSVLDAIVAIAKYEKDYRNFPFTATVIKRLTGFDDAETDAELLRLEQENLIQKDDREKYYLTQAGMDLALSKDK
jgi:hypothetical protein